ncbi:hypothetical protein SAMN05660690_1734 [Geodermatophilus telluris]|uniref:Uncharacterized protein n=1 Tax=Geodermatophilus telluris TaxID=1190417 RepID=A0A1G6M8N9_9ACTN|nr:hypothetical protein SAMN05660690_1734 [Geodermatophilus telluris]
MRHSVAAVQGADVEAGTGPAADTVVVHVQLRPRRGSTRRCLAELAALAAAHPAVGFGVSGLGKDERVVRVTVGVELGPREAIARFSPQAQAAYAFVSDLFTVLYDHMPVYATEPGPAERAAAEALLGAADPEVVAVPGPRSPLPGERVPA